jgi:hypothetical protein
VTGVLVCALVLGLALVLWGIRRLVRLVRRRAWQSGYEEGYRKGDLRGYERYAEEVGAAMPEGRRAAMRAARTRHALTPRADRGEYSGASHLDPPGDSSPE